MATNCIEQQADEFSVENEMPENGSVKILSIGRFCTAKNFDNIPDICRRIVENGLDVKWYIIGFGGDEALIHSKIMELGMEKRVIVLGKKTNPYPYIKACDLYVQPSRYEGNAVTVHEAQYFHKPVIITKYETSSAQLEDGVDGVIVPLDNEGCATGIEQFIKNCELRKLLSDNCRKRAYSNIDELEKIYQLVK